MGKSGLFEKAYEGDIEGTTTMLSNDPDFFGVLGIRPRFIEYLYSEKDIDKINEGIEDLELRLSHFKKLIVKYIKAKPEFTKRELSKFLGVEEWQGDKLIEDFKKLTLGYKIRSCVENTGRCYFTVEL